MTYYVNHSTTGKRSIIKEFNTKKDALKYAYTKAKNFRSDVVVGRPRSGMLDGLDGRVVCIKNKRFYITFNHKTMGYGREYILHSDGTLGE